MSELVSIITPLYNSEAFIEETILSVINQTYSNWEMIIVDDNSKDNGVLLVKVYQERDSRIVLVPNQNSPGAAGSRNTAITLAKGRYIAFLDSDDLWMPEKLEIQIKFMQLNEHYFTYTFYEQISEEGNYLKSINNLPLKVSYKSSMMSNKIGCLTAVYDVKYFGKVYMENIVKRQDYTLWLKLLKKVKFAYCVPEILSRYRITKGSISSNKFKLIKYHWYIYRKIEKQTLVRSLYYLSNYIFIRIFGR